MEDCIGCKTRQQIAQELNISRTTLYRRLKQAGLGIVGSQLLSPAECKAVYKLFGRT